MGIEYLIQQEGERRGKAARQWQEDLQQLEDKRQFQQLALRDKILLMMAAGKDTNMCALVTQAGLSGDYGAINTALAAEGLKLAEKEAVPPAAVTPSDIVNLGDRAAQRLILTEEAARLQAMGIDSNQLHAAIEVGDLCGYEYTQTFFSAIRAMLNPPPGK